MASGTTSSDLASSTKTVLGHAPSQSTSASPAVPPSSGLDSSAKIGIGLGVAPALAYASARYSHKFFCRPGCAGAYVNNVSIARAGSAGGLLWGIWGTDLPRPDIDSGRAHRRLWETSRDVSCAHAPSSAGCRLGSALRAASSDSSADAPCSPGGSCWSLLLLQLICAQSSPASDLRKDEIAAEA